MNKLEEARKAVESWGTEETRGNPLLYGVAMRRAVEDLLDYLETLPDREEGRYESESKDRCDFDCDSCHERCQTPGCACGWDWD